MRTARRLLRLFFVTSDNELTEERSMAASGLIITVFTMFALLVLAIANMTVDENISTAASLKVPTEGRSVWKHAT